MPSHNDEELDNLSNSANVLELATKMLETSRCDTRAMDQVLIVAVNVIKAQEDLWRTITTEHPMDRHDQEMIDKGEYVMAAAFRSILTECQIGKGRFGGQLVTPGPFCPNEVRSCLTL